MKPSLGTRVVVCAGVAALLGWAVRPVGADEFRAFWADAFHTGFKSQSAVDSMVSRAVAGRYNAIVMEVMAYHDRTGGGHGAYWNSSIVPEATDVSPAGFDALGYAVQAAHNAGLELHAWILPYRACTTWPPSGNATLQAHPEWLMSELANMGGGPSVVGDHYALDPGSPDVQEYLLSIIREIITNYAVDGIHFDYIRYTQADAGYPSSNTYAKSGLARFRTITPYAGTPGTSYGPWDDFRRREVTELVRRTRAEVAALSSPGDPIRLSAALITWGNAPSQFSSSSAWVRFQNWEEWMRLGYLDTGIPMTYFDHTQYPSYYYNWVDAAIGWRYDRQMVIGPGIYLNSFADSKTQMLYARNAGADGLCTFSYAVTRDNTNDWSWYTYVASNVFTAPAAVPAMPWRDPATATEGTLWGRVTDGSGDPVDDATVAVGRLAGVRTDGNGYYVVTLIGADPGGREYAATAQKALVGSRTATVVVMPGDIVRQDFVLTNGPQVTIASDVTSIVEGETVHFTPTVLYTSGTTAASYTWHFGSTTVGGSGAPSEIDYTFGAPGPYACYLEVTDTDDQSGTSNVILINVAAAPHVIGDLDGDGDVDVGDFGAFQSCFNGPGRAPAHAGCEPADIDKDGDVDVSDFGGFQYCFNGPNRPPSNGVDCYE